MADLRNVPGGAELLLIGDPSKGQNYWYHLSYTIPGTNTRMVWAFPAGTDTVKAITGETAPAARQVTWDTFRGEGMLHFGTVNELVNRSEHPFDAFVADFEKEAQIRPWLRDAEVLALTAQAILEGRTVTQAELQTTKWWTSRNEAQRQWAALVAGDPAQARRIQEDNRIKVAEMLRKSGLQGVPESAVHLMADRLTVGDWSEEYVGEQARRLVNPTLGAVDPALTGAIGKAPVRTGVDFIEDVRAEARRWLGPVHGRWDDALVQKWAGRLATEPGAQDMLTEELRRQRLALFPEYEDERLDYESIAQPWRGVVSTVWGQVADESDAMFERIVRMNDRTTAEGLLRSEGLKRGVKKVTADGLEALSAAFAGGGVRKAT
ncbi:MAG TPA: hypothetical protein VM938_10610 [Acidimicrobiales bacterium]|nr:hypothetical protein [Acidimicrobiales bacterium]